jgi:hypothetical protein
MLAGRPHEAVGNGSPRWMIAAPRKRAHRTRPTGRLTPFKAADLRQSGVAAAQFSHSSAGACRGSGSAWSSGLFTRLISVADANRPAAAVRAFGVPGKTP